MSATTTMKLLKLKGKSFRKSKKRSSAAAGQDDPVEASQSPPPAANNEEATVEASQSPPPAANNEEATKTTPPASGEDGPSEPGREHAASSPSKDEDAAPRPLRLGSFNFEAPDAAGASFESGDGTARTPTPALPFPSLFHEADAMLALASFIYPLAELRDLARNGVLNFPSQSMPILDLPLPLEDALRIVAAEEGLLREVLDDGSGRHEATLSALQSLLEQRRTRAAAREEERAAEEQAAARTAAGEDGVFGAFLKQWDGCLTGGFSFDEVFCGNLAAVIPGGAEEEKEVAAGAAPLAPDASVITAVGDLKNEKELVFAVEVNPVAERITVIFRGSVNRADFASDARTGLRRVPGPGSDAAVGIHAGFHDRLFGEAADGGAPSKFAEISRHVERLRAERPERARYRLYATGHGTGGALAALFGFRVAAQAAAAAEGEERAAPVSVVSAGAPRAGDRAFARAFAELESRGRLRHLRVANHRDPVAAAPTVGGARAPAAPPPADQTFTPLGCAALTVPEDGGGRDQDVYYHTGMQLKLFKKVPPGESRRYAIAYAGSSIISGSTPVAIDEEEAAEIEQSNKRKEKDLSSEFSNHWGASYFDRLASVKSHLKRLTLNGLYRDL